MFRRKVTAKAVLSRSCRQTDWQLRMCEISLCDTNTHYKRINTVVMPAVSLLNEQLNVDYSTVRVLCVAMQCTTGTVVY